MRHFIDNSIAPIIAIDFDGTISIGDGYPDPHNGDIRPYAKEIINFLYDIGVKVVIWTNRKNVKGTDIMDKLLMKQWLDEMGVKYHTVNDTTHFAPFKYYGRKIYAHMFVDDRGYGFSHNSRFIMIDVLREFLCDVVGCDYIVCKDIGRNILLGQQPFESDIQHVRDKIANWNRSDNND